MEKTKFRPLYAPNSTLHFMYTLWMLNAHKHCYVTWYFLPQYFLSWVKNEVWKCMSKREPRRRTTCSDSWHDWSQYVTITYVEETTNWLVFHKNKRRYTVLLDILPNRLVSHLYHFYRICITIFHEVKKIISNLTNILIAKVFERMSKKKNGTWYLH